MMAMKCPLRIVINFAASEIRRKDFNVVAGEFEPQGQARS
jgi:hypothetical protein